MRKYIIPFKLCCFSIIFIFLLNIFSSILMYKNPVFTRYSGIKGFYELEDKNLDAVFIGTSHVFNGVYPIQLWENYGITSYILAGPSQHFETSYVYMKEAIEKNNPSIILVDIFSMFYSKYYYNRDYQHQNIDYLNWGLNRLKLITKCVPNGEKIEYLFNVLFYHNRWDELKKYDFIYSKSDITCNANLEFSNHRYSLDNFKYDKNSTSTPLKEYLNILEKIIILAEKNNTKLVFTYLPMKIDNIEYMKIANSVDILLREKNIPFINFNLLYENIGLDFEMDLVDLDHLNYLGATKVTEYLGEYLKNNYDLVDKRDSSEYTNWNRKLEEFQKTYEEHIKEYLLCIETCRTIYKNREYFYENFEDNYESNPIFCKSLEGDYIKLTAYSDFKYSGNYSGKIDYTLLNNSFAKLDTYLLLEHVYNWENKNGIQIWLKPDDSNRDLILRFKDANGRYWNVVKKLTGTEPEMLYYKFDDFKLAERDFTWASSKDVKMDLSCVTSFEIAINNSKSGGPGNGTIYIDSLGLF